jgi:hypothetical protein
VDDVTSMDGAFGSRMPKLKAAGLDGWRLEHIALLVLGLGVRTKAAFADFGT